MYGGVAGHAGLFGTANDLAVIMQVLLNKGTYGGITFFSPQTIEAFTKRQSTISRRGWGWDKPEPEKGKGGSAGKLAPKSTFLATPDLPALPFGQIQKINSPMSFSPIGYIPTRTIINY